MITFVNRYHVPDLSSGQFLIYFQFFEEFTTLWNPNVKTDLLLTKLKKNMSFKQACWKWIKKFKVYPSLSLTEIRCSDRRVRHLFISGLPWRQGVERKTRAYLFQGRHLWLQLLNGRIKYRLHVYFISCSSKIFFYFSVKLVKIKSLVSGNFNKYDIVNVLDLISVKS